MVGRRVIELFSRVRVSCIVDYTTAVVYDAFAGLSSANFSFSCEFAVIATRITEFSRLMVS